MVSVSEATASLVADRPDVASDLETLLDIDADGTWTFDDIPIDSGTFGEIVSRGIAEEVDGGYRITDREGVRRGLEGDTADNSGQQRGNRSGIDRWSVEWQNVAAVAAGLLIVVIARLGSLPAVYRNGDIVLSGNDPYAYRYVVEALIAGQGNVASELVTTGEPLFVATLQIWSMLFGGTPTAVGHVLAWYPVVTAVLCAAVVYRVALVLTNDRRVALAALLLLAVTPAHAFRTSFGFADHHAFDYFWLAVTVWALVSLPQNGTNFRSPRTWLPSAGVGVGIAGQTLAWEGGPLLLVPIGLYGFGAAALAVDRDSAPYRVLSPLLVGLSVGAVLTLLAHVSLGWQSATVATVPLLIAVGVGSLVAVTTAVRRFRPTLRSALTAEAGTAILGGFVVGLATPDVLTELNNEIDRLLAADAIAETQSLFGSSMGWLLLFGFVLFVAIPFIGWGALRSRSDTRWLVVTLYAGYLLVLSALQARFAGELSVVVAVFAGMGLVQLAAWIDVARPVLPLERDSSHTLSIPQPRQTAVVIAVVLLVTSLSLVQIPIKTAQVTTDDETYQTATWISTHVESGDADAGSTYVFSQWSNNRVYNYFVNGKSRSYGYARENYESFLGATNGSEWYHRLQGADRDGFVVTTAIDSANTSTLQNRLHENLGSRTESAPGVAHYRIVYATEIKKVFAVVPGATVRGEGPPNTTVTVSTPISATGIDGTYRRQTQTDETGEFALTVAHPGQYTGAIGQEELTVTVERTAVRNGSTVTARAQN